MPPRKAGGALKQGPLPKKNPPTPKSPKKPATRTAFVHKLYGMLNDPSLSHLIWWQDNNTRFALVALEEFLRALNKYFKHANILSFVRQLHMYGFHKVQRKGKKKGEDDIWEFSHDEGMFRKGGEEDVTQIRRRQQKSANPNTTVIVLEIGYFVDETCQNPGLYRPPLNSYYPASYPGPSSSTALGSIQAQVTPQTPGHGPSVAVNHNIPVFYSPSPAPQPILPVLPLLSQERRPTLASNRHIHYPYFQQQNSPKFSRLHLPPLASTQPLFGFGHEPRSRTGSRVDPLDPGPGRLSIGERSLISSVSTQQSISTRGSSMSSFRPSFGSFSSISRLLNDEDRKGSFDKELEEETKPQTKFEIKTEEEEKNDSEKKDKGVMSVGHLLD